MYQQYIRNFVIIAHIDHGKSTLADRLLELTGTIEKRKMKPQYLDQMDLERERGITIKMQPVRMEWKLSKNNVIASDQRERSNLIENHGIAEPVPSEARDPVDLQFPTGLPRGFAPRNDRKFAPRNDNFILNLIDTPGHADFAYEVSRSLSAVEGAILLVDAAKGIQAQTLSNFYLAKKQNLTIIPVINKIDLKEAQIEKTQDELQKLIGVSFAPLRISAKQGTGVQELLHVLIEKIPPPQDKENEPLQALIFDSFYDSYKGVIAYVRLKQGRITPGQKILMLRSQTKAEILDLGIFKPHLFSRTELKAGEIGWIATGLKDIEKARIGDTITSLNNSSLTPLPGYQEPKPMVFASFYPSQENDFELLKDGLNKLKLNDASLFFEPESSGVFGRGFKLGFLGMLHLEIISERLKREYGLDLIITTPSVALIIKQKDDREKTIFSPLQLPDISKIQSIKEPWTTLEIITPSLCLGKIMELLNQKRGVLKDTQYLSRESVVLKYEVPLSEIIIDFYDKLKNISAGFASMSYELEEFKEGDLVKVDILVAKEKIEALSQIVPRQKSYQIAKNMVEKLKEVIPPQLFAVSLQAAIDSKIIARENISAKRKDVTGYLYGGDYTRKKKLLQKQKRGKKKLKALGKVKIPPEVFFALLKR